MSNFTIITECVCCGSDNLEKFLSLGNQAPANSYTKNPVAIQETFPLEVNVCKSCYNSQLTLAVDPNILYSSYIYVSSTSSTFALHQEELADYCIEKVSKTRADNFISALDLACNDGQQLEIFRDKGCFVHGVDPAENLREITLEKNILVTVDYWREDIQLKPILGYKVTFDIITATNVLAHVPNPIGFLKAAKRHLNPNGIIVVEFTYGRNVLKNFEFDIIYHEHISHFTASSIQALAKSAGLSILDMQEVEIHGGSLRVCFGHEQKNEAGLITDSDSLFQFIEAEEKEGLYKEYDYLHYQNMVDFNIFELKDAIRESRLNNLPNSTKVVGYGASAKSSTMLTYSGIPLDYICDDSSMKWNYYTPNTNIPIVPPNILKYEENLIIICTAWNFSKEIEEKISNIITNPCELLYYIPSCYSNTIIPKR